jgi:hypothetical protein
MKNWQYFGLLATLCILNSFDLVSSGMPDSPLKGNDCFVVALIGLCAFLFLFFLAGDSYRKETEVTKSTDGKQNDRS